MKLLLKFCLVVLGALALIVLGAFSWLSFDTQGLPDPQCLSAFAPLTVTKTSDPCAKSVLITALPYDSIGPNLRSALSIAEKGEDDPGVFMTYYLELTQHDPVRGAPLSALIAKYMCYQSSQTLHRMLDEMRMAVQLERRFSRRELFTIAANRMYFGEGKYGVDAASQYFFHKEPSQLSVGEAALLAAQPRAPSRFSPSKYPDEALRRRNQIIDAMVARHAISEAEGATAKANPLAISVENH